MARTAKKAKAVHSEEEEDSPSFSDESETEPIKKSKNKQRVKPTLRLSSGSEGEGGVPVVRSPLSAVANGGKSAKDKGKRRLSGKQDNLRRQSLTNARLLEQQSNGRGAGERQSSNSSLGSAPNSNGQELRPPTQPGMRVASGSRIAGLAHARANAPRSSLGGLNGDGPQISQQAMTENYDEWMKMATDNKINTNNTWSITLIDYFHDMSLLRNPDDENSINFQKASITLDGCVKIWTSRVDSTATAVGKLMNGLADDGGEADNDAEEGDASGNEGGPVHKKRKRATKTNTLADSFSKIQQKQLDLEAAVDPLFKKTCADFDEGGASGILMNHLGLDRTMRIVFDASDSKLLDDKEEEEADREDREDDGQELIDVSQLKANFLSNLEVPLSERCISPSLAGFKFSSDAAALDMSIFSRLSASLSSSRGPPNEPVLPGMAQVDGLDIDANAQPQDFFAEANDNDDFGGQDFFDAGGDGPEDDGDDNDGGHRPQPPAFGEMRGSQDSRHPNEHDVVLAMSGDPGHDDFFDYFDNAFVKNWAGPEHWRMHRAMPKRDGAKDKDDAKAARKEKQAFSIDFTQPRETPIAEAFARPKEKGPSIQLKITAADRNNTHLLPDDMHFSSAQLLRLFIKPKAWISLRKRTRGIRQEPNIDINQDVDENYWAQAAANADDGPDFGGDNDDDGPLPFNTQFLHDDENDMPDFPDDEIDMDVSNVGPSQINDTAEDDLLAATQGQTAKRARPEYVNFAKRAKRVDVKRLKESIWKELALPIDLTAEDEVPDTNFTNVLGGLRKVYPKDKMDEISTSFCFICLLHLANENGLSIKATEEQDIVKAERAIGGLIDLQINRQ